MSEESVIKKYMVCSKALAPSRVRARALLQALNYNYSTGHDMTPDSSMVIYYCSTGHDINWNLT